MSVDPVSERLHAAVAMALADEPSRVTPENVLGAIREGFLIVPRAELEERLTGAKLAGFKRNPEGAVLPWQHEYAFRSNEQAAKLAINILRRMQA